MLYLKSLFLLVIVALVSVTELKGQDVVFTQYYGNPIYLNPALAGNKICPRITLNYRNEWPSINKGYVSYCASWDRYYESISGGIAINANADVAGGGALSRFVGSIIYSYKFDITNKIVGNASLQAGYFQYRLNWDKLIFGDQIIPGTGELIPTNEPRPERYNISDIDFATGFTVGYNERFYIGGAVHHLTTPDLAFYSGNVNRLDLRITAHAGALIDIYEGLEYDARGALSFSPNILYMQQGKFHQLNTGVYVNMYPFVTGIWLRHSFENPDALILLLGFEQPNYKIGYSFDFTISQLSIRSGGSHEISMAWMLPCPKKEFRYKAIKSPSF